jgi:hypothetical protein
MSTLKSYIKEFLWALPWPSPIDIAFSVSWQQVKEGSIGEGNSVASPEFETQSPNEFSATNQLCELRKSHIPPWAETAVWKNQG